MKRCSSKFLLLTDEESSVAGSMYLNATPNTEGQNALANRHLKGALLGRQIFISLWLRWGYSHLGALLFVKIEAATLIVA